MSKQVLLKQITQIKALGFSDYEARVYVCLLKNSPATAYEISKTTGIARANVYSTCENLVSKKAAQVINDNPRKFIPVPPELLFSNIASETKTLCENAAEGLKSLHMSDTENYIWSIEGSASVNRKVTEMIAGASTYLWIKASSEFLEPHKLAIETALKENPSLNCVIVLFGNNPECYKFNGRADVHLHEGTGTRLGDADNLFTITTDHKIALTARLGNDVIGAYTSHEPIVTMAETIVRHDVYMAEIFVAFGDKIDEEFGPHLQKLRLKYFTDSQYATFSNNLRGCPR
jgi:HTH-type transcriptional regulator, sugar sensing transcriptional regulator